MSSDHVIFSREFSKWKHIEREATPEEIKIEKSLASLKYVERIEAKRPAVWDEDPNRHEEYVVKVLGLPDPFHIKYEGGYSEDERWYLKICEMSGFVGSSPVEVLNRRVSALIDQRMLKVILRRADGLPPQPIFPDRGFTVKSDGTDKSAPLITQTFQVYQSHYRLEMQHRDITKHWNGGDLMCLMKLTDMQRNTQISTAFYDGKENLLDNFARCIVQAQREHRDVHPDVVDFARLILIFHNGSP